MDQPVPSFQLVLKNDKQRLYYRLTFFLLLFNTMTIAWLLIVLKQSNAVLITGLVTVITLVFTLFFHYSNRARLPVANGLYPITGLLAVLYWLMAGYWWMAVIVAGLFCLHFITKRPLVVLFYADRIEYPSFPKKIIPWKELSNVVLKDDWLTVDFKNNRIIQQFTNGAMNAGNEKEFNDFCRQLLNQ